MKYINSIGTVAVVALAGFATACAPPAATPAAAGASSAGTDASTAQASPPPSKAATATSSDAGAGKSAPPVAPQAASAKAAAATPGATSGTISGQVTATPAKYGHHVVVWLDSGGLPAKQKTIEINQHHMKFIPYLSAVPVGGRVLFHNSDPFPHNVFTPDGDKFNLGMMPSNSTRAHVFKQGGPYTLLCHIHPGMIAFLYVVPSKYYAISDRSGHFTIKDVPNGSYRISAWAPHLATSTESVSVAGGTATVALHVHRGG